MLHLLIFRFLLLCQGLVQLFQLQRLQNISAVRKPKEHLITFLYTFGLKSYPVIKICQFISPLLTVILFLQLLQYCNSLFQADFLCLIKLILKNVSARVLRRKLHKFLIVFDCLHIFFQLNGKLTK